MKQYIQLKKTNTHFVHFLLVLVIMMVMMMNLVCAWNEKRSTGLSSVFGLQFQHNRFIGK